MTGWKLQGGPPGPKLRQQSPGWWQDQSNIPSRFPLGFTAKGLPHVSGKLMGFIVHWEGAAGAALLPTAAQLSPLLLIKKGNWDLDAGFTTGSDLDLELKMVKNK